MPARASTPPPQAPRRHPDDGRRLVRFPFVIGIVVGVLRRTSEPRAVHPNRRLAAAVPFIAANLAFGWWALPRGPWFTLQALWTCLRGGEDVTPGRPPSAPALGAATAAAALLALTALPPLAGALVWRELAGRDTPWVLVNGLREPYTVEFAGRTLELDPDQPVALRLPEGTRTWTARLPRGEVNGSLTVRRPWYAPWRGLAGVVTPDGAGVLLLERADYAETEVDGEYDEDAAYGGAVAWVVREPDFVLEPFPTTTTTRIHLQGDTRTRLASVADFALRARHGMLERSGPPGSPARFLGALLAQMPDDLETLHLVVSRLPPDEALTILRRGFDLRPLPLDLHRHLQDFAAGHAPEEPLAARYAALAAADPGDGIAAYLAGRANPVLPETLAWHRKAVAAARPCTDAWLDIATALTVVGDWNGALEALDAAARAGADPGTVFATERLARHGLGDPRGFLALIRERRRAAPLDEVLAAEEIRLLHVTEGADAARTFAARFLAEARAGLPGQGFGIVSASIRAVLSDTLGQGAARGESPAASIIALARRGAVDELALHAGRAEGDEGAYLLLEASLVAAFSGQDGAARRLVDEAFRLRPATVPLRFAADFAAKPTPAGAERLTRVAIPLTRRRVLLGALALRFPEHRGVLAVAALQSNADPSFPHAWVARLGSP